jgi:hypothetical protein
MGALAKVAADQQTALQLLHDRYDHSGTYDGDDELRTAVTTALGQLDDFVSKLRHAEDSGEFTPAGLAARRRTLREPLVLAAEKVEQRAEALTRHIAKSEDEAWTSEIAPARDALDAATLVDIRNQLAALPEPLRTPPLMDPSPLGRLARRAAFGWPSLSRLVSADVEQRARAEVVRRRVSLSGAVFTASELRQLARRYRAAVGIEEPPIRVGGSRA